MNKIFAFAPVAAWVLLMGCGGGGGTSSVPATSIYYSNPGGSGWRLLKDASSTDTRLVLSLVGPASATASGVALTLQASDTQVTYAKFSDGTYIQDGGTFKLYATYTDEPQLLAGGVKNGQLTLGAFQKNGTTAVACGSSLLKFALEIPDGAMTGRVPLTIVKAQMLDAAGTLQTISVSAGTLKLK